MGKETLSPLFRAIGCGRLAEREKTCWPTGVMPNVHNPLSAEACQLLRGGAAQSRNTATLLERSAAMHERLMRMLSLSSTVEAGRERQLLASERSAMLRQAACHRKTAAEAEMAAGVEEDGELVSEPLVDTPADGGDGKLGPSLLRAAVFGAAVALPAGVTLGVGAITAAPYLGIDPDGSARARVRAILKRDSAGRFLFQVRKNSSGEIFISSLPESDAADERGRLVVGDQLHSIDGRVVSSAEQRETQRRQQQALIEGLAEDDGPSPLDLEGVKELVRAAGESILVEVCRKDIRPVVERLKDTKSMLENDVARVAQSSHFVAMKKTAQPLLEKASALAQPLIEKANELKQHAQPHLERLVWPPEHSQAQAHMPAQPKLVDLSDVACAAAPSASSVVELAKESVHEGLGEQKDRLMEQMQAAVDADDFDEASRLQDLVDELEKKARSLPE